MLFCGEIATSFQPWYIRILPPRALNLLRSGSTALMKSVFSFTNLTSRSTSNFRQSHLGSWYASSNEPVATKIGCFCVSRIAVQLASLPIDLPGKITLPSLNFDGAYIRLTLSSCGAVRQVSASPALQARVETSNLHAGGLVSRPSLTPSCASHAFITAALTIFSLACDTSAPGVVSAGTALTRSFEWRCE